MDTAASILGRLQSKAKKTGKSYQLCLQLFCQEEFLRRISLSKYSNNLILKGGLFIYTLTNFESRTTTDIDFLLKDVSNSHDKISEMVDEIIGQKTGNDFIVFEKNGISDIARQREYNGVNVKLLARIKNTKTPLSLDIGIGDVVYPGAERREISTQLDDFTKPVINTYSIESTIAEKFDAMLQRLELTSRMKDFFDVFYLANTFDFNGIELQEAISKTLKNRQTHFDKNNLKEIVNFANDEDMNVKWINFLKKQKLSEPIFSSVMKLMDDFLTPIYDAIVNGKNFHGKWSKNDNIWIE